MVGFSKMPEKRTLSRRNIRKKPKTKTVKRKVLKKMLAVMEQPPQGAPGDAAATANCSVDDFLNTGRTGRRNALPDILSDHAVVTTSDLPARLQSLSASDGPSTSGTSQQPPETSQTPSNANAAS